MTQLNGSYHDLLKPDMSKRKTCNLSLRITADELTWLVDKAQSEGHVSVSEYIRNVLFRSPKLRGHGKEYGPQIAHLERDLQSLRQDVEKIWSRLRD